MNRTVVIPDVFKASHQFYYALIRPDGYYVAANANFLQQFQLTESQLSSVHSFETVHPDDQEACTVIVKECIQNPGKSYSIELRKPLPLNTYLYTKWEFTCVKSEYDDFDIQCIGFDISKEAEQKIEIEKFQTALNNKHEMLAQMLDNAVDVFILVNKHNEVLFCSPNIEQIIGYKEGELIGKNGFSLVHPDDLSVANEIFQAELVNPGNNKAVDIRISKKNGTWLWTEAKGKNLFNNPYIRAMLINLNDISQRKYTEDFLRASEERYKAFFNNMSLPLLVVTKDYTQILDVNEKAIRFYGYSSEEFRNLNFLDLFEDEINIDKLSEIFSSNFVVEHRTKQSEVLLVTISRHEVAYSGTTGYLLQITDVTETYKTQKVNELGFEISDILIQQRPYKENLQLAIQKLRTFLKWDLCELWIPSFDGVYLKNEVVDIGDNLDKEAVAEYLAATGQLIFPVVDYVKEGQINNLKPVWIDDFDTSQFHFKRLNYIKNCGLQSGFINPVTREGKIVCCLVLMNKTRKSYNRYEVSLINPILNLFGAEISKQVNDTMLNNFFFISGDILTIAGMDGRYIHVNPAFEKFSGYTGEEAKSIHPLSYVHDFDKPAVLQKLLELSEGKSVEYFENRIVTKKGETKWIAWTATPLIQEAVVIASHRDITAQKEMIEALAVSNERYEYVKRATNEAIWDYDIKANIIIRSEGYKQLFAYETDNEHTSFNFWESKLHPDDRERVKQNLHSFLRQSANNQWQCEYRFLKGDGTYAYVSDKGFKIHDTDGMPIRFVGAMQDITEQKQFAEKLRLSNERYMLVTNATQEAIWDLDFNTQGITWSDGYRTLFGHGYEDAEPGKDFWESNIHPDDRELVVASFSKFLKERSTLHWECEYRFQKRNGSYSFVSDKCYLIYDKDGKPIRVVGAMQDITRQKNLEREIIEKERSRQKQIAQAAVFAQEKERADIGKELHDNIGQLLTTTKLYLEMLKNNQESPAVLIGRSTDHINSVINEVRNLSRSLVPHSLKDLGLIASINDLIDSFRLLSSFNIDFIYTEELEEITDNTLQLTVYRIIQEKLNNIVRHAEATNVNIELTINDNQINLHIEDNGKGFDLRTIKKGQGITNIISRAELYEGTAEIVTNPGQGCILNVSIPINKK